MYQMMQLPGESLVQYEDLEVLLDSYAPSSLPESNWPLFATNSVVSSTKITTPGTATFSDKGGNSTPDGNSDSGVGGDSGSHMTGNSPSGVQAVDKDIRGLW